MFMKASTLAAFAATASAHMVMNYPVPYGQDTLNNSPLEVGDYPCKQRPGVYDVTEMNQWNAGETKEISFMGSATHGGGSCQFSITTDKEPSESSQWKVIHSVVGGCPSDAPGNLSPADPNGMGANTFPVTMPESIPDGQYSFAWTWLNKRGNREFYMNCAPIQVGSGSSASTADTSALAALPDMFVANIPADSCSTSEDQDFDYPNPGDSVATGAKATPGHDTNGAGCASMTAMGAGNGQMGTPSEPTGAPASSQADEAPAVTSAVEQPSAQPSAAPSNPGGVFAPGASSAVDTAPTSAVEAPAPPAETEAPAPPADNDSGSDDNSTSPESDADAPATGGDDCTPCDKDGAVVCIGTTQWGLCNRGCAVAQDMAAGMACDEGTMAASARRSARFAHAHLRRHGSKLI